MVSVVIADDTKSYDGTWLETRPLGGTESSVIRFARAMARRGHDVTTQIARRPLLMKACDGFH